MINFEKKLLRKFDYILFLSITLLSVFGFISLYASSIGTKGIAHIGDVKTQAIAFLIGIVTMLILTFFDYDVLGKFYLPIYIFCNLLLIAVLLFGTGEKQWGARSWLVIGSFSFQPSEIVKIGTIISVAKFIEKNSEKINELFTLIKVLTFSFIPVFLILLQPDFGTAVVFIFFIVAMLFVTGLDIKYFLYAGITAIASMFFMYFFTFDDYQKDRLNVFLNPEADNLNSGYHVAQSKIAIGSGKKLGRFLFDEINFTSGGFLPEKHTDFIFSVIGEAFGLIGGLVLISLYFIMIYRLISIAKAAKNLFGSLVIVGVTAMMVFHVIQNIGMTMGLLPVTGIPLPFISKGGTFLISNMISIGLALSIGIRKNKINF
ncbi:MAG: rod shape-determining protein RodA [Firmicutes bacterium]|nr:rod shape-determining protein RodA [Bacillota bacterium]